jgi:MYXO-CTERM domain-containing protein
VKPVCAPNGGCNPCDGDNATGSAFACQLGTAPYCFLTGATTGSCGVCTSDADCTAGHAGTACNKVSGNCGAPCTDDSQCKAGLEWCAGTPGVCTPKTRNGEHVPMQSPINGDCTPMNGVRTCLSTVCEMDDDLCGLHNGSPCMGTAEKCRSTICFPADQLCGKPAGEPCMMAGECRSAMCTAGVCAGCTDDNQCGVGKVCDKDRKECVNGCREVNGKSNCISPKECSKHDGTIGQCVDGAPDGGTGTDAGLPSDAGLIEGGGCSCRTTMPISGSPLALAAAAAFALLVARRRRERTSKRDRNDTDNQDQI